MAVSRDVFASFPIIDHIDYAVKAQIHSVDQIITGWATVVCDLLDPNGNILTESQPTFSTQIPQEKLADFQAVVLGTADQETVDSFHTFLLNTAEASSSLPIV